MTPTRADAHALAQMTRAEGAAGPRTVHDDVAGVAEDLGSLNSRFGG